MTDSARSHTRNARRGWRPIALATTAAVALGAVAPVAFGSDADYNGVPTENGVPAFNGKAGLSGLPGIDMEAPVVTSRIVTSHLRTLARTGKLTVTAGVNERGGVAMVATMQMVKARAGKKLSKKIYTTPFVIKYYGAAGSQSFALPFNSKARRVLRDAKKVKVGVLVAADDAVKNRAKKGLARTFK